MVRIMVGTLLFVSEGKIKKMKNILTKRKRYDIINKSLLRQAKRKKQKLSKSLTKSQRCDKIVKLLEGSGQETTKTGP